jgi:hypothetical protein
MTALRAVGNRGSAAQKSQSSRSQYPGNDSSRGEACEVATEWSWFLGDHDVLTAVPLPSHLVHICRVSVGVTMFLFDAERRIDTGVLSLGSNV